MSDNQYLPLSPEQLDWAKRVSGKPVDPRIEDIAGMAAAPGTGPKGKMCQDCGNLRSSAQMNKGKCALVMGRTFLKGNLACRHFEDRK